MITGGDSIIGRFVCYHFALEGATVAFTDRVVDQVMSKYGQIDILVSSEVVQHYSTTLEKVTEVWLERLLRTNIYGHFFWTKDCLKHMKEGSWLLDYSSTKSAIVSITRALALKLINEGIGVNAEAPGPLWTPLQPASLPGRAGQPYEIAPSFVFLTSDDCSSYLTS
uniref:Uncharacterized protein n=1 Tax=Populus trichocarpa TaxID=3694 RepID=A0A2K1Y181_POPTR